MRHRSRLAVFVLLAASLALWASPEAPPKSGYNPPVAKASDEAQKAIARFKVDKSLKVDVWAAEPLLANPVAFCFDEKGRCYVAETFRLHHGVTDTRGHMDWLDQDLACRTIADRVAMYRRHDKDKFEQIYAKERDRVRLVEDTKGAGKADKATVFCDDFGHAEDGLGAGVLARDGNVYFTCIPDLWLLKDTKATGRADVKKSLATGFGVHTNFIGHDLHGLRMGPDGRLYFSIGDRGINVTTREGKHLFHPDTGMVLRCEPDGSHLEVVHVGLRNPQELAFDDFGNLFTVDNNSDSGDQARWVYIAEGGDSGWRIGFQYGSDMSDRGPWNAEKIWHLPHKGRPAYALPPLKHYTSGPSGLAHYPGLGLSDRYKDHFFVVDFRGSAGGSGIRSFAARPKGASFEMVDDHEFIWNVLATDCDFGPDGAFYLSDWVNGWNLTGKGRIYKVTDPEAMKNPGVAETKKLLAEGFRQRPVAELVKLLSHPHQQVRTEAQFALAAHGAAAVGPLGDAARGAKDRLARLHAVWGLEMVGRKDPAARPALLALLEDRDAEVRAQAAKACGPLWWTGHADAVLTRLKDSEPRVRYMTALAMGRAEVPGPDARTPAQAELARRGLEAVVALVTDNADRDLYLRHAAVVALSRFAASDLAGLIQNPAVPVRRAVLLALRKQKHPSVADFLADGDAQLVADAARAIHDEDINDALPKLAAVEPRDDLGDPVLYRVLNARFRLGRPADATALAAFAARPNAPEKLRVLALKLLGEWAKPSRRDHVTGLTQDLGTRPAEVAVAALRPVLAGIFTGPAKVQKEAAAVAGKLGGKDVGPFLFGLLKGGKQGTSARVEALRALEALKDKGLTEAVAVALASDDPRLRNAARGVLVKTKPGDVLKQVRDVLDKGDVVEKQGALDLLGAMKEPGADALVEAWLDRLLARDVPAELQLDVLEAAGRHATTSIKQKRQRYEAARPKGDDLAAYREALAGGDAENGRRLFLTHAAASCQRCHKLDGVGGDVGPPLNGIGSRQKRDYLLEAIVLPNKQIAKGYDSVVLTTLDGKSVSGVLRAEDAQKVTLITPEGKLVTVPKADIDERRPAKSAMPEDLTQKLTKAEIRDLVEFLANLKEDSKTPQTAPATGASAPVR